MKAIERAWLECATAACLRGVPVDYIAECRYAFYRGARTILTILDDRDAHALDAVRAEIDLYFSAMRTQ